MAKDLNFYPHVVSPEVVTLPRTPPGSCSAHEGNEDEGVWVNFLSEGKKGEELLVETSGKIAHLRRYHLGGTWFCIFSFLDPLGSIKRKKMGDSV